ncbi:MAG: hypothetical protein CMM58_02560 [Rhodospirillaceae bacterium]|nr:hypothetical protein [Rhodospirillaceae bacterium]
MLLTRHGESIFNRIFKSTRVDPGIIDPPLTELGFRQLRETAKILAQHNLTRIICSPYRRALQSACTLNQTLNVPISVTPLVREQFGFSCDIGTSGEILSEEWPRINFSNLRPRWWPENKESFEDVVTRANSFFDEVNADPLFDSTLVVTHWGFIRAMTGLSVTNATTVKITHSGASSVVHGDALC